MGCTFSWFTFSASFSSFSSPATLLSGSFSPNVKFNCWMSKDKLFNWIMVCVNDKHPKIPKVLWWLWRELLNRMTTFVLFPHPRPPPQKTRHFGYVLRGSSPNLFLFSSPSFVCFCKSHLRGFFIAPNSRKRAWKNADKRENIFSVCKPGADLGGEEEGAGGAHPLPPQMTCGFLQNIQICMISILSSSHYVIT